MRRELGMPASALAVARHYEGLLHGLVIDVLDADQAQAIEALGMRVQISQTVMNSPEDKSKLAADVLRFARNLAGI
jgi:LPPG:FO 2-phospho-L-lactate transferase